MIGFLEAQFLGLDAQDVADLNAALPFLQETIAAAQKEYPRLAPHIPALMRIFQKVIAKERSMS